MKPIRSHMTRLAGAVLAVCAVLSILGGCATTGRGREPGPEDKSSSQSAAPGTSVRQATATTPEAAKASAVSTRVAAPRPAVQKAPAKATAQPKARTAVPAKRDWGRLFREALSGLDWNRVLVVVGGMLGMAFFWILAFWLGRLPGRGGPRPRRAAIRGAGQPVTAAAVE